MALKNTHKYDDIIDMPRPVSNRHSRMTNYDRAAQFSPFAALTGFEEAIEETGRRTEARIELEEDRKAILDEAMARLQALLPHKPEVEVTFFVQDGRKAGGSYCRVCGRAKKLDSYAGLLLLEDSSVIPLKDITDLQIAL